MIRHYHLALFFYLVMDDRQRKLPKQFSLIAMVKLIKLHEHYIFSLISNAKFMEGDQFFKLAHLPYPFQQHRHASKFSFLISHTKLFLS